MFLPSFKAFLNMYVDETASTGHARGYQSTTEDDNPPSPMAVDTLDSLLSQPLSNSPVIPRGKQDGGGLRFQNPMTPPSNPHTPASPSTQRHAQVSGGDWIRSLSNQSPGYICHHPIGVLDINHSLIKSVILCESFIHSLRIDHVMFVDFVVKNR